MNQLPANWQTSKPVPSRRSSILPAVITIGCSLLFLIGSLFGALTTCDFRLNGAKSENNMLFMILTGLAALSFVAFVAAHRLVCDCLDHLDRAKFRK